MNGPLELLLFQKHVQDHGVGRHVETKASSTWWLVVCTNFTIITPCERPVSGVYGPLELLLYQKHVQDHGVGRHVETKASLGVQLHVGTPCGNEKQR